MDTKWKKSKIILSFAAFFLGLTLLLVNFFSMMQRLAETDFQAGTDYQETEEFAAFISGRLETLIGAAAGGEEWYDYSYGTAYETAVSYETGFDFSDWWASLFGGSTAASEAAVEITMDTGSDEAADSTPADELTAYMEELSRDRNLLFAVVYQGKLLYTNLDGLSGQEVQESGIPDFASFVPEEEYNFTLLYNGNGDGRVEITKDGQPVDVYGDGIYRNDSRWYVPGYANFQAEGDAKEAVVFLAAAKEPKLYVENYGQGTVQRGWDLYSMQENLRDQRQALTVQAALLGAALLFLFLAFRLRKERQEAREWLGKQLGKVWYEIKFLLFWCLPVVLLVLGFLTGSLRVMFFGGIAPVLWFWLLYFGFLDRKYSKGRQKSLLAPFRDSLRTADLERPFQKRMVKRQWLVFAPLLLLLAVLAWFWVMLWDWLYWDAAVLVLLLLLVCAVLALICSLIYMKKNRRLAEDMGALTEQIAAVRAGELSERLELPRDTDLREAAENLNEIQQGMEAALAERTKSERM